MNLSVDAAIRVFGDVAVNMCKEEIVQLFMERQALRPVKWDELSTEQKRNAVRSHMFLKEKYEDDRFVKMKACLVVDGRMQDRTVYLDYLLPNAKTRSVMTCLKIAAMKNWDLLKLDVGGAFLCAHIDADAEVLMFLDKGVANMCIDAMLHLKEYLRDDGKLFVKVDKAMYGLIQSANLLYRELSGHVMKNGFKNASWTIAYLLNEQARVGT
jgi:hypothetical protein